MRPRVLREIDCGTSMIEVGRASHRMRVGCSPRHNLLFTAVCLSGRPTTPHGFSVGQSAWAVSAAALTWSTQQPAPLNPLPLSRIAASTSRPTIHFPSPLSHPPLSRSSHTPSPSCTRLRRPLVWPPFALPVWYVCSASVRVLNLLCASILASASLHMDSVVLADRRAPFTRARAVACCASQVL